MPVNKFAAIRYRVIDQMIGNQYRPYPTMEDLRQGCEDALFGSISHEKISTSTLEKDIQYMKLEYDAPIKYSRSHKGYYYSENGFSIDLNSEQIEAIKMAANVLSQFRNTDIFSEFHSAIDKILDRVNISSDIQDKAIQQYVQFETSPVVFGTAFLGPILEAIKSRTAIIFDYKKFQSEEVKERNIHPYLLKEHGNRWYIIGYDIDDNFIKTFALDRMQKVIVTTKTFNVPYSFDVDKFFKYNVGITTFDAEPKEVLLKFAPLEGNYVKSQPLHWTQEVLDDNNSYCLVKIKVIITNELIVKILSYGQGVKVEAPDELADKIKMELGSAFGQY